MPKLLPPLLAVTAIFWQPTPAMAAPDESAIIHEMNRARADPVGYARELEPLRRSFHGRIVREPGRPVDRITNEGVSALDEAIAWLRRQRPRGPLDTNNRLALAARDHTRSQGPTGVLGHGGHDGSSPLQRIERRGLSPYMVGEVIAYGPETAREVVRELIIDDGVADRGHRDAIFEAEFTRAGAACGPHAAYGAMCVVEFADDSDSAQTASIY
ncbi:MAG: CAP domain-containing protein [Sphingomonas sp.]